MARRKMREWCHWCDSYQEFEYDPDDLGEQVIICPRCGHDHYRRAWDGQLVRTGRQSVRQRNYMITGTTAVNTVIGTTTVRMGVTAGTAIGTAWTFNSTTGYFYPNN